ncbi:MAG: hypothetical protein L6Q68_02565 [Aquabacterium sp.]|nr:hypothetical protein [Aquabacterium sp.]
MATNLYVQFRRLLPTYPLQVAEVISTAGGQAVVELPGGGQMTVRGTGSIGAMVYVRDGLIEGPAPTLPVELIDV